MDLRSYLLEQSLACRRPPLGRFQHAWLAPMPAPANTAAHDDDGFARGDYSQGLFHHDVSEAALFLLDEEACVEAVAGSLLCFLDCASPNGRVHRAELAWKSREAEPAKPVIAQLAARVIAKKGAAWASVHDVVPRVLRWVDYLADNYTGLHGLMLTHSSLASGFDSDLLSAGFPDKTIEGPDTSTFMILEYRAAALLAEQVGLSQVAARYRARAEHLRFLINALLYVEDERGGFYCALRWQHGVAQLAAERVSVNSHSGAVPLESWVSLLPLYAGVPDAARAKQIIRRLLDPLGYWGPHGVRTLPAWDPFFNQAARIMLFDFKKNGRGPVSNWCGPVWVLSNYYMATALAAYGYANEAAELRSKTLSLLESDLARTGRLHESYDDDGRGLWPRSGTFISWNVLALL